MKLILIPVLMCIIVLSLVSYTDTNAVLMSPLKQIKSGMGDQNVECEQDFQLLVKVEDDSPACVSPQTTQKLIERGWAESLASLLESPIKKMDIIGLNGNYKVGQPINAMINYTGYENPGVYPDVKILDENGTQIWDSCCVTVSESPTPIFSTFTFNVQGPTGNPVYLSYPVINKTGTYTMIASLDNKTAEAKFVVSP